MRSATLTVLFYRVFVGGEKVMDDVVGEMILWGPNFEL